MSLDRLTTALADRYRLERELGQGGMATVYLAHDLRHDRRVAVKVFRPELSALLGTDRFLQEIRVTANLQHPHILPLYDSGSADGLLYYVMPFVDGETLRERLAREKQLPVPEAVAIARGVAAALDYAHRHGVIHRDIKPENILLHEGQPLVADFGIALAVHQAGGDRLTQTGLSLGTPSYMSPEQATGDRVLDGRTDVYALAAVAYEMLAGDPPHTGSSAQAVIAKVVTEAPPRLTAARPSVPAHVEAAVLQALSKLPADRFATAGSFAEALERPGLAAAVAPATTSPGRDQWRRWPAAVLALAMLLGGLAVGWLLFSGHPQSPPVARLTMETPGLGFNPMRTIALSPDGRSVVFFGSSHTGATLRLRRMVELGDAPIPGAEGFVNPAFSPDGRRLVATHQARAQVIDLTGGAATVVPGVTESAFIVWVDRETLAFAGRDGRMWTVGVASGAEPRAVATPDTTTGERVLRPLDVLPGGRHVLVLGYPGSGPTGLLDALDLRTGRRTRLLDTQVRGAWYAGRNTLVFTTLDGMLHGIAFDPGRLAVAGAPVTLGGPVETMASGSSRVATSRTGTVLYVPLLASELVLVDRSGGARALLTGHTGYHNPHFSPDGHRVAVDITEPGGRDVWIYSLADRTLTRASFENDGRDVVWSRDGRAITYMATWEGQPRVLQRRLDGSPPVVLQDGETVSVQAPGGWTADGGLVVVAPVGPGAGGWDLVEIRPDGSARPIVATPFREAYPDLSADGRWLAYVTDEARRFEVYVRSVGGGDRLRISTDGGTEPRWSAAGNELFYITGSADQPRMAVARLDLTGEPRVVWRDVLIPWGEYEGAEPHANYDVAPDGQSFVAVRRVAGARLVLIQNVHTLVHGTRPAE